MNNKFNDGYEYVKLIFANIFDDIRKEDASIPKIASSKYSSISTYITDVFESDISDRSMEDSQDWYLPTSCEIMKMEEKEFKRLLLGTIYNNLYFFLVVISQNINQEKITREAYLKDIIHHANNIQQADKEKFVSRFRQRMKRAIKNKPILIKQTKEKEKVTDYVGQKIGDYYEIYEYYMPPLLMTFYETIFVPRVNTNIYDISSNFIDIFTMLMNDLNETNNSVDKKRKLIKQHKVWEFTDEVIKFICETYQKISQTEISQKNPEAISPMGDNFAQLLLLEKLFGISSISKVLQKPGTKIEKNKYINCIKPLVRFGYSPLHESIIGKLKADDYFVYGHMIRDYIVPVIRSVLRTSLYDILYHLDMLSYNDRKEFIQKVKSDIKNSQLLALSEFPYIIVNSRKSDREFYIKCINKFVGISENVTRHPDREKGADSFLINSIYDTYADCYPQHPKYLRKRQPDTFTECYPQHLKYRRKKLKDKYTTTLLDCNIYDLTFYMFKKKDIPLIIKDS